MSDSKELLPCPFCGDKAELEKHSGSWGYYPASATVVCRGCGASSKKISDKEELKKRGWEIVSHGHDEAVEAWNRRAQQQAASRGPVGFARVGTNGAVNLDECTLPAGRHAVYAAPTVPEGLVERLKAQSAAHRYMAEADSADLLDEAIAALAAAPTPTRLTDLPKPGAYSPQNGGIFIGVLLGTDGQLYGQILARKEDCSAIEGEWGSYGTKLTGADSYDDGLANTRAMAAAGSIIAAQVSGLRIGGFDDWHIPARLQGLLAHGNASEHLPDTWIWISRQDGARVAWRQDPDGYQTWYNKDYRGAVVPVRRFLVI